MDNHNINNTVTSITTTTTTTTSIITNKQNKQKKQTTTTTTTTTSSSKNSKLTQPITTTSAPKHWHASCLLTLVSPKLSLLARTRVLERSKARKDCKRKYENEQSYTVHDTRHLGYFVWRFGLRRESKAQQTQTSNL